MKSKSNKALIGSGIITAIAASLCCITPVLALIAGTSVMASLFSWMEPIRPYLMGFTILVLGFAWYQKLKPKKEIDCDCETDEKPSFFQSKLFLGMETVFATLMLAFPYYSFVFYPKSEKQIVIVDKANIQTINLEIKGMTCASCEEHINHSVNQLNGILKINSSYVNENSKIEFDNSKITIEKIEKAVNSRGYSVIKTKEN